VGRDEYWKWEKVIGEEGEHEKTGKRGAPGQNTTDG
jgi:hypothetical protein